MRNKMKKLNFTSEGRNFIITAIRKIKKSEYDFSYKELVILSKLYALFNNKNYIHTNHIVFAWNILYEYHKLNNEKINLNFKNNLPKTYKDLYDYYKEFYEFIAYNAADYEKYYVKYQVEIVVDYYERMLNIWNIIQDFDDKKKDILINKLNWINLDIYNFKHLSSFLTLIDIYIK